MRVLAIAVVFFASAFLAHWLVWRVRMPARQSASLLAIFSATLLVGLLSTAWWPARWQPHNPWEVLHIASFHIAAMLAYVVAYSALEERSPSMTILSRVADSGARGRSREELHALLEHVSPVEIRLAAMVRDGMVRDEADDVVLTGKGWVWAETFSAWRRMLRFERGG